MENMNQIWMTSRKKLLNFLSLLKLFEILPGTMFKKKRGLRMRMWIFLIIVPFIWHCSEKTPPVINFDFNVKRTLSSDDSEAPFFFASILDVCANSKYIYVSDWKNYCIKVYDHQFNFLKKVGRKGNGPGEFGQIFVDMTCSEKKLFLITINRLYIFNAAGEFLREIVLRFMPNRIFPTPNGFLFKTGSSQHVFTRTDFNGSRIESFYENSYIISKGCGKIFPDLHVFMTKKENLFIMDSMRYNIQHLNLITRELTPLVTRDVDFLALSCRKGLGGDRIYKGGYSWMLDSSTNLYYFYFDSKNQLRIDVFTTTDNNWLKLEMTGRYNGNFHPLCLIPDSSSDTFIGIIPDESHSLLVCKLKRKE